MTEDKKCRSVDGLYIPRQDRDRRQNPPQSEFSGSAGPVHWKFLGYDLTPVILIAALGAILYIVFLGVQSLRADHKEILEVMKEGNELQAETNYINSRPLNERPPIPMPRSLECKLNPSSITCVSQKRREFN